MVYICITVEVVLMKYFCYVNVHEYNVINTQHEESV